MKKLTRNRLQPGHPFLGLLAMASLLVSSVDAGPRNSKAARPSVQVDVPQFAADSRSKNFIATRIADDDKSRGGRNRLP